MLSINMLGQITPPSMRCLDVRGSSYVPKGELFSVAGIFEENTITPPAKLFVGTANFSKTFGPQYWNDLPIITGTFWSPSIQRNVHLARFQQLRAPMESGVHTFSFQPFEQIRPWMTEPTVSDGTFLGTRCTITVNVIDADMLDRATLFTMPNNAIAGQSSQLMLRFRNDGLVSWLQGTHFLEVAGQRVPFSVTTGKEGYVEQYRSNPGESGTIHFSHVFSTAGWQALPVKLINKSGTTLATQSIWLNVRPGSSTSSSSISSSSAISSAAGVTQLTCEESSINVPRTASVGQPIEIAFTYRNTGSVPISVTQNPYVRFLPSFNNFPGLPELQPLSFVGNLPVGTSQRLIQRITPLVPGNYLVVAEALVNGQVVSRNICGRQITITSGSTSSSTISSTGQTSFLLEQSTYLPATKARPGGTLAINVRMRNNGSTGTRNLHFSMPVPDGLLFASVSDSRCRLEGAAVVCGPTGFEFSPQTEGPLKIYFTIPTSTPCGSRMSTKPALVTGNFPTFSSNTVSQLVTCIAPGSTTVEIQQSVDTVSSSLRPGGTIVYDIIVKNTGSVTTKELTLYGRDMSQNSAFQNASDTRCSANTVNGRDMTCGHPRSIITLPPGTEFRTKATYGIAIAEVFPCNTELVHFMQANGSNIVPSNDSYLRTKITCDSLARVQIITPSLPSAVARGQSIPVIIGIKNVGSTTISQPVYTLEVPGLRFVGPNPNVPCVNGAAPHITSCQNGSVSANQTWYAAPYFTIPADTNLCGQVIPIRINLKTANAGNREQLWNPVLSCKPDLQLSLTSSYGSTFINGQRVTYALQVRNTLSTPMNAVTVRMQVPSGFTFDSSTSCNKSGGNGAICVFDALRAGETRSVSLQYLPAPYPCGSTLPAARAVADPPAFSTTATTGTAYVSCGTTLQVTASPATVTVNRYGSTDVTHVYSITNTGKAGADRVLIVSPGGVSSYSFTSGHTCSSLTSTAYQFSCTLNKPINAGVTIMLTAKRSINGERGCLFNGPGTAIARLDAGVQAANAPRAVSNPAIIFCP